MRNTEQDIINAARKVFQEKGFKEATMRNIADEAKINMAMLHYYFRSKENLFYIVFDEVFSQLYEQVIKVLSSEEFDIFEKIRNIVNEYISFFVEKPYIPHFIMGEIIRNPERIGGRMSRNISTQFAYYTFSMQLKAEQERGVIRPTSALELLINTISLCIFPVVAKPLFTEVMGIDTEAYNSMIEERKKTVADLLINSIRV